MYRVVFPFELKLRNTTDDCPDAEDVYHLFAVVVHVGSGPNHGKQVPKTLDLLHKHVIYKHTDNLSFKSFGPIAV